MSRRYTLDSFLPRSHSKNLWRNVKYKLERDLEPSLGTIRHLYVDLVLLFYVSLWAESDEYIIDWVLNFHRSLCSEKITQGHPSGRFGIQINYTLCIIVIFTVVSLDWWAIRPFQVRPELGLHSLENRCNNVTYLIVVFFSMHKTNSIG